MLYSQVPDGAVGEPDLRKVLAELLMDWDGSSEYHRIRLGGTEYMGKIAHSELCGWYLVDMVNFLTFFLSVLLFMYNYMPIRKLYNLFDKKTRDRRQDELKLLNEYIRDMLEEQGSLDMDSQPVQEKIVDMGLHLDKKYMAAIVLKATGEDMQNFGRRLYSDIAEKWAEDFYLTERSYKYYDGFLACTGSFCRSGSGLRNPPRLF